MTREHTSTSRHPPPSLQPNRHLQKIPQHQTHSPRSPKLHHRFSRREGQDDASPLNDDGATRPRHHRTSSRAYPSSPSNEASIRYRTLSPERRSAIRPNELSSSRFIFPAATVTAACMLAAPQLTDIGGCPAGLASIRQRLSVAPAFSPSSSLRWTATRVSCCPNLPKE